MGQVVQAGAGQNPARQAAVAAGHPVDRARDDHQQGLPQRADRDHRRRPDDPARRGLRRGRRRPGVDEPGTAPAARLASRVDLRRHPGRRLPGVRRAHRRVRPRVDGLVDRAREQGARRSPARRRTGSPSRATGAPPRPSQSGVFAAEIVPVEVPQRRGAPVVVAPDEGIRPETSLESLAVAAAGVLRRRDDHRGQRLPPDRRSRGRRGGGPRGRRGARAGPGSRPSGASGQVAGPDNSLHSQPSAAISAALGAGRLGPVDRRPPRDQRGVRVRRRAVARRPRLPARADEHPRRRDRARAPDRGVGGAAGRSRRDGAGAAGTRVARRSPCAAEAGRARRCCSHATERLSGLRCDPRGAAR